MADRAKNYFGHPRIDQIVHTGLADVKIKSRKLASLWEFGK